jgi:hypothetical protein
VCALRCRPRSLSEVSLIFWKPSSRNRGSQGPSNGALHKRRLFGPGTIVALAVSIGVLIVGFTNESPGHRLVSKLPAPTHPLWKPEPAFLLTDSELRLSPTQRRTIQAVDRHWRSDREALLSAMTSYQPHEGNEAQIRSRMQDYSDLSRRYDAVRTSSWSAATASLSPAQRAKLPGGTK